MRTGLGLPFKDLIRHFCLWILANFADLVPGSLLGLVGWPQLLFEGFPDCCCCVPVVVHVGSSRFLDFVLLHPPHILFSSFRSPSLNQAKQEPNKPWFLANHHSLFSDSPLVASPHSLHSLVFCSLLALAHASAVIFFTIRSSIPSSTCHCPAWNKRKLTARRPRRNRIEPFCNSTKSSVILVTALLIALINSYSFTFAASPSLTPHRVAAVRPSKPADIRSTTALSHHEPHG